MTLKLQEKVAISSALTLAGVGFGIYKLLKNNLFIKVKRLQYEKYFTYGKLYLNGSYFCDTLEDTYRGQDLTDIKVYGDTAIPYGRYKTIVSFSPKFNKYTPELLNVPFFTNIRIHAGSAISHTQGCILVGRNINGEFQTDTLFTEQLVDKIKQYPNCLTIVEQ